MDRVVWVGASPRGDAEEIRTVVSSALAVGFGEVVLSKPDESLQRLGRFSPILLKGSTFVLGDAEVGRRATIRSAKDEPLGRGVRVCVDTCSLQRGGEGMLVGNSSTGLFLIHAETIETGDVAARPFRVNAGPVHAYIYLPTGTTKYLSELRTGDDVLAVDAKGRTRSVVVGRVKIERRPLLLVEAEIDDRRYSTIVQNAETVRFVTVDGGSLGVSDLRVGSEVLLRVEEGGRHFGMPIRETIAEQ